jgi:hypothetical protein
MSRNPTHCHGIPHYLTKILHSLIVGRQRICGLCLANNPETELLAVQMLLEI